MKRILSLLVVLLIAAFSMGVSQCSLSNIYPEPTAPICELNKEAVLCKLFAYVGVEAEQVHDMLLDATLVPVGLSAMEASEIVDAIDNVSAYVEEFGTISFNDLVLYAVKEAEVNPAFGLLISRRLSRFVAVPELSYAPLDPASRKMVLDHLQANRDQFAFFNRSR